MRISAGWGGWLVLHETHLPGTTYLRFGLIEGRLRVVELYVDGGAPVDPRALSRLPIAELEMFLNLDREQWELRLRAPGPDLSCLASYYSTTFGRQADHWVKDSMQAQIAGSGVAVVKKKLPRPGPDDRPSRPRLMAPERLDDDFLRAVAVAYIYAAEDGLPPAPTLAQEAGVVPKTVHKWIAKARAAGHLPPGQQGRIG